MTGSAVGSAGAVLVCALAAGAQQCEPGWSKDYAGASIGGDVRALAVFEVDGQPRLFAGGDLSFAPPNGPDRGRHIGWWDGTLWNKVGGVDPYTYGAPGCVNAMVAWDDGQGLSLFVAGEFHDMGEEPVRYVARWDGQAWHYMETGLNNYPKKTVVRCLAVFDDGTGPALYAGGTFSKSGDLSQELFNIAKWDGQHWQAVGGGLTVNEEYKSYQGVWAMAAHDDGSGPALYVGGVFDHAGDQAVQDLAKWNGYEWSVVSDQFGPGVGYCISEGCIPVHALASFDDGTGPALYIGGHFQAPEVGDSSIARLRGAHWEPAGALHNHPGANDVLTIDMLSVQDTGDGPELYAGGTFMNYDPMGVEDGGCLARWDAASQSWTDLDANPGVSTVAVFDDPEAPGVPCLWVGGTFISAGTKTQDCGRPHFLGIRDPGVWRSPFRVLDATRTEGGIVTFDDGSGPALYLGSSSMPCHATSAGIKRLGADGWSDVGSWADMDPNVNGGSVSVLSVVSLGDGPKLYGLGELKGGPYNADNFDGLVCWDGERWSKVGPDLNKMGIGFPILIFGYDDGEGPALFMATRILENAIYRLTNGNWVLWADGIQGDQGSGFCAALEFDDGNGPALWVGGSLSEIEGVPVNNLARHRAGTGWEPVGDGADDLVKDFAVWDDGGGPELYVSGFFRKLDGKAANRVARWNGKQQKWQQLGKGINAGLKRGYAELCVAESGPEAGLWAFGNIDTAGDGSAAWLAHWDGAEWTALDDEVNDSPLGVVYADVGEGPTLYATGWFSYAGDYPSAGFGEYRFCEEPCAADLDGSGSLDLFDFLIFVNLFNAGEMGADCDVDEVLDLSDFLCFVNAFNAGC